MAKTPYGANADAARSSESSCILFPCNSRADSCGRRRPSSPTYPITITYHIM